MAGWSRWWGSRRAPDFVAREIVGPLAIADLVAVHFDQSALRDRRAAGIRATDDLLALRVLLACRRSASKASDLASLLGVSQSGVRRAVRIGYEIGALEGVGRTRHQTHPSWRPAGHRMVAVELKRSDWRRAAHQAWAYQAWANAAWLVLGQRPPASALIRLAGSGIGLAYLGEDERTHVVQRPTARRRVAGHASVWAAEQTLVHALASGADPLTPVRPSDATWRGASALHVH